MSVHQTTVRSCQYIKLQYAHIRKSNYSTLMSVHPNAIRSCQYIQLQYTYVSTSNYSTLMSVHPTAGPIHVIPRTNQHHLRCTATVAVPNLPRRKTRNINVFDLSFKDLLELSVKTNAKLPVWLISALCKRTGNLEVNSNLSVYLH